MVDINKKKTLMGSCRCGNMFCFSPWKIQSCSILGIANLIHIYVCCDGRVQNNILISSQPCMVKLPNNMWWLKFHIISVSLSDRLKVFTIVFHWGMLTNVGECWRMPARVGSSYLGARYIAARISARLASFVLSRIIISLVLSLV